ncbi:titin-like [Haliotis rubra]|uniref:titin-like n=1 Tax=Haliotis rubra TaxID=36100 RepID=UPI001EE51BCB|nr:titin-like [Haliotis rubra]
MDIGHFTKTMPELYQRLISKCTDPSEMMDKEPEPAPGENGRKRRRVVTPEESLGTGDQVEETEHADEYDEAEVVDEGQVYIDKDWTEDCQKEEDEFEDEHLLVTFLPDEGQFVLQEIDEEQMMKDVDKIVSSKALVEQSVVKKEVDQIVVNKPDEDQFVESGKDEQQSLEQRVGETSIVQKKDKGQFGDDEQEQNVIREESENVILVKHEVEEANVVKENAEQCVVHRTEDWVVVLQEDEQATREGEDEAYFVSQGTDKEQLLVNGEEQIVLDEEQIVVRGRVEQTVLEEELEQEHIVVKEKVVVQDAVDDCIVIEQEGEPSVVREEVQQNVVVLIDE